MSEKSIYDVKQVIEVAHDSDEVNQCIGEGWILLLVYPESTPSDSGPAQYPVYVLGWPHDQEPPTEERRGMEAQQMEYLREMVRRGRENKAC